MVQSKTSENNWWFRLILFHLLCWYNRDLNSWYCDVIIEGCFIRMYPIKQLRWPRADFYPNRYRFQRANAGGHKPRFLSTTSKQGKISDLTKSMFRHTIFRNIHLVHCFATLHDLRRRFRHILQTCLVLNRLWIRSIHSEILRHRFCKDSNDRTYLWSTIWRHFEADSLK
jgi:hypothetical protein